LTITAACSAPTAVDRGEHVKTRPPTTPESVAASGSSALKYALFALVIPHAFLKGARVRTGSPYALLLLLAEMPFRRTTGDGIAFCRRRYSRKTVEPAEPGRASK
jgi:hypothetical protein